MEATHASRWVATAMGVNGRRRAGMGGSVRARSGRRALGKKSKRRSVAIARARRRRERRGNARDDAWAKGRNPERGDRQTARERRARKREELKD